MPSNTFKVKEVNAIFNADQNILELYNTIANVKGDLIKI